MPESGDACHNNDETQHPLAAYITVAQDYKTRGEGRFTLTTTSRNVPSFPISVKVQTDV